MYRNSSVAQNSCAWKTIRRFHVNSVEALESFWMMHRRSESPLRFFELRRARPRVSGYRVSPNFFQRSHGAQLCGATPGTCNPRIAQTISDAHWPLRLAFSAYDVTAVPNACSIHIS
jgi:hypothetical protein